MAERRMFSKTIVDSDNFLEMPVTSQLLYFHLSMRADDDGFIDKPKSIMRITGCKTDDLKLLIKNKFIIPFESGIVVIRHWKIHNYIQKDRYKSTIYQAEMSQISTNERGVYNLDTECIQTVSEMDTQVRLGKDRLGKDRLEIGESNEPDGSTTPTNQKPVRHKYGEYKNVLLSDDDFEKLKAEFPSDYQQRINRMSEYMKSSGKTYKDHLATIRSWARKDEANKKPAEIDNNQHSYDLDELEEFQKDFLLNRKNKNHVLKVDTSEQ